MNNKVPVLPKEAYFSQDWFDMEQEQIFSRTWQFAGLAEDVSEHGQYKTVQAGNCPLLIVNNRGELAAYHNLCRHRGVSLLDGQGTLPRTKRFMTCPYHHWTYDLTGKLVSIPQIDVEFPDLQIETVCLHKASVEVWRGMLWVHPDPDAPSAAEWFGVVEPDHLCSYKPEDLQEYPEFGARIEVQANWKILVENFVDVYHFNYLHCKTVAKYVNSEPLFGYDGPHFWCFQGFDGALDYGQDHASPAAMPLVSDSIPEDRMGTYVPMFFPNFGLQEDISSWTTFHVIPVTPRSSIVEIRMRARPAQKGDADYAVLESVFGAAAQSQADAPPHPLESGDFIAEDIFICEQIQKGILSPKFEVRFTGKQRESTVLRQQSLIQEHIEQANCG